MNNIPEEKIFGYPDPEEFENETVVDESEPNDLDDYRDAQND